MKHGIVPEGYLNDAHHVAIATVEELDAVVSWNLEHIVKLKTMCIIEQVNAKYKRIILCTPEEVL